MHSVTVWKFQDFYATQILREINFWDSVSSKTAIFAILKALNFGFNEFLHFVRAEMCPKLRFRASKMIKFALFGASKLA